VAYDPAARCPRFEQALAEWIPDAATRQVVIEFLGYCLIPDVRFQKLLFLQGSGANGKGVLCSVIENLLGRHNVAGVPLQALRSERTFPTAALVARLVNICPEAEHGSTMDEAWIKSLVAGDPVEVEKKGRDPFLFANKARFIIQSNNPPRVDDKSDGFWRRLLVVVFPRTFAPHEMDADLGAKLRDELPGVLNLALSGLRNLLARGRFEETPDMLAARESYRRDNNSVMLWRDEHLKDTAPNAWGGMGEWLSVPEAYKHYQEWTKDAGHNHLSRTNFTRELKRQGMEICTPKDAGGRTIRAFRDVALIR
jgi:putative DNA primase/helicase